MVYSAVELEQFNELRNRIRRLRLAMNRCTFRATTNHRRNFIAQRIATRIMELQGQLPSNAPAMPRYLILGGNWFVPIRKLDASTVVYKRDAGRNRITVDYVYRPDIYAQFKHLFE